MPTYAYACTSCDNRFEVQQSFSDQSLTDCPTCEGRVRKLFNSVGIVFKGSGFYRNDSRKASESSEKPASPSSDKPAEKKSDGAAKPSTTAAPAKDKASPSSSSAA